MDIVIILWIRNVHEFSFHIAAAFRSYLLLACELVYTLRTLSVEQMSWAGLLLAGPGHLKSLLIAIIKRPINDFPGYPVGL